MEVFHLPRFTVPAGATLAACLLAAAAAPAQEMVPVVPAYPMFIPDGPEYGDASARLQVTPKETEVFIDGRSAGKVEQFSGFSERVHVLPGGRELTLYLEGYRTVKQKLYFQPGTTYKIKFTMEKLAAGETSGPRPEPPKTERAQTAPPPRWRAGPQPLPERSYTMPESGGHAAGFGTLVLRVQPADATVWVDGSRWDTPDLGRRLSLQLAQGLHQVEIRKDGFTTYMRTIEVREGQVTPLNVSLPTEEPR